VTGAIDPYDAVPYPSHAYWFTHPDYLATCGTMYGVTPARIERCSVLEIGCGAGGNLFPIARTLPGATILGVDRSRSAIDEATRWAQELGLSNLQFRCSDFRDLSLETQFDYVICHGLHSWIPRELQVPLMNLCAASLAPHGVAVVSFNVYPGWREGERLRNRFLDDCGGDETPELRIKAARVTLEAECESAEGDYHSFVVHERHRLDRLGDAYLFHEYLSPDNCPTTLTEFAGQAGEAGLQFLADAHRTKFFLGNYPPDVLNELAGISDQIAVYQRLDEVTNRRFRASLLVRAEEEVNMELSPDILDHIHVRSYVEPDPALETDKDENRFTVTSELGLETDLVGPLVRTALSLCCSVYPRAWSYSKLFEAVADELIRLGHDSIVSTQGRRQRAKNDLGAMLTRLYYAGVVHFHSYQPQIANSSVSPRVGALAAREFYRDRVVTNAWHDAVTLQGADLDGFRAVLDGETTAPSQALIRKALFLPETDHQSPTTE